MQIIRSPSDADAANPELCQLIFGILGAIGSAIMIVLLFAYGIPLLLFM